MKLRWLLQYAGVQLAVLLARFLPLRPIQGLAAAIARRTVRSRQRHYQEAMENLRIAFPERSRADLEEIARESHVHLFWNGIDLVRGQSWSLEQTQDRVSIEGREVLDAALAKGKGVLILTLHMGCFELAVRVFAMTGVPVLVVNRPLQNPLLDRALTRSRERFGARLIDRERAAPQMLRQLRRGGMVAALNDRYARSNALFVPFFGVRAATAAGLATIALRTDAAVVPGYIVRDGPDHHTIHLLPSVEVPTTGDRGRDIEAAATAHNEALAQIIRRHPEQWMWRHRRFRHSPDLPPRAAESA